MTTSPKSPASSREAYTTPALKEFGPVGKLTQSGTSGTSELMTNGMCSNGSMQQSNPMC